MAALLAACLISSIRIRRSQAVLGEENRLFDAALSNMAQGLNVFDKAGRLVLSNNRYIEMYGLSRETVKPGAALLDLVNLRLAAGTFFKIDPERYAAEVKALARSLTPTQRERELADGRVINVVNCPLAGGGWVVTHEDVTERWRAEREVESTHNFLQTVIENVPTTIVVKDARTLCYVLINRAAEEFYGVPREQMIGKTAVEMFSPRTAETITARDRQLLETGSRQQYGETSDGGAGRRTAYCQDDAHAGRGRRRYAEIPAHGHRGSHRTSAGGGPDRTLGALRRAHRPAKPHRFQRVLRFRA